MVKFGGKACDIAAAIYVGILELVRTLSASRTHYVVQRVWRMCLV